MTENKKYVDRNGQEISLQKLSVSKFSKNGEQGHYYQEIACSRCGGRGGADAWKFTGFTCYRCNAATRRTTSGLFQDPKSPVKVNFYSEEKLRKLEESARKRAEKKAAKKQQEHDTKWNALVAEFESIIETAEHYAPHHRFVASVLETVKTTCFISEKQEQSLISAFSTAQKYINEKENAANEFVGSVGERIEK